MDTLLIVAPLIVIVALVADERIALPARAARPTATRPGPVTRRRGVTD